jgi:hypothetical protein
VGCSTVTTEFNPKEVKPDEGVIVGFVQVFEDGKDVTRNCTVSFNKNAPYVALRGNGLVIAPAKVGPIAITRVACLTGAMSARQCSFEGATFENVGHGKQTYFGDVKLEWNPSGANALLVSMSPLAGAVAGCNGLKFSVTNETQDIKDAYKKRDPEHVNVHVSLVSKPKSF